MADGTSPLTSGLSGVAEAGAIVFALAGRRYAIGLDAVEGIAAPPVLTRVPYAAPGLLGAGNLSGQVVPIVDLAALLPGAATGRRYDGGGAVLRLRAGGGRVGVWVDRTERLIEPGTEIGGSVELIDPEPLVRSGMAAPGLGGDIRHPLGDVGELVEPRRARVNESFFLVETAGEEIHLPYEAVLEFVPPPPFASVPGTPPGFIGVGILRGDALPMLSLASLLGLSQAERPAIYAVILLPSGHRVLLGCRSVVGARNGEEGRHFDPRGALPRALRRIVTSFPKTEAAATDAADGTGTATFLSFVVDDQLYALPVDAVERVVPPQRPIALPHFPGAAGGIAEAIELRGQIVPVARLGSAGGSPVGAYVILRGEAGFIALGADRAERLVALRPEQIAPPPNGDPLIDGVAIPEDGGDVLRILARDRIGERAVTAAADALRVLVVDDQRFMCMALRQIIEADGDMRVVGEARNGEEACALAHELKPDVVTMDIEMPVMDGLAATRRILAELRPAPVIIMVSGHTRAGAAATVEALRLGAADFVSKASAFTPNDLGRIDSELRGKIRACTESRRRSQASPPVTRPVPDADEPAPPSRDATVAADLIAIAASTGGPATLAALLPMIGRLAVPIVIAQHMPEFFTASLAQSLTADTGLAVREGGDREPIAPDEVTLLPGGKDALVAPRAGGGFELRLTKGAGTVHPSADVLFESVAMSARRPVAVILTGMGDDGTRGAARLARRGLSVLVQRPDTCVIGGMPAAAIEAGVASEVLSLDQIAARLRRLATPLARPPEIETASPS